MKFVPTIPRSYLFALAGAFWTIAGGILCTRGIAWMGMLSTSNEFIVGTTSVLIASCGYIFGFSKIVQKNIDRIEQLPDSANIFLFTPLRGYIMIALMISIGVTLRNSSIPKYYLTIPYESMGGVLLVGSVRFYRQFIGALVKHEA